MVTIHIDKSVAESLKTIKENSKQSYSKLIAKMIYIYKNAGQYDEFLYKIQQPKMKELWDNEEDEEWENA